MVDPALLDNGKILLGWKEYLYHARGSLTTHSIMQAGLVAGAKDTQAGRQTVFFTDLDPMSNELDEVYQDHERHNTKAGGKNQDAIDWIG